MSEITEALLRFFPIITCMMLENQLRSLLESLDDTLQRGVPGAVVELGCLAGTASLFIERTLFELDSDREFHVYDSFAGLPQKQAADGDDDGFVTGGLHYEREKFEQNFHDAGMELPHIHVGWFADIPDEQYPEPIAFAFFDGDFYSSIVDSFAKVYRKVAPGGVICVHDYDFPRLPGVKLAVDEFMADKPDTLSVRQHDNLCFIRKAEVGA